MVGFLIFLTVWPGSSGLSLACRRVSGGFGPSEDGELVDVVEDVGEADFHFGPLDPDGSDDQTAKALLKGEDMLDRGALL